MGVAESTQGMFEDLSAPSAIVEAAPLVDAAPLVTPPVEAVAAPMVEVPSFAMPDFSTPPALSAPVVDNTELIEAKRKIAELEARLAEIGGMFPIKMWKVLTFLLTLLSIITCY